ncbi:uncharacterized protein LOC132201307 [Neocloeon triangulifer]|uniref:uncharacterized protein LOC132201307 n=1 Tax=Neocloeon triangulifer TaxID=2078957 RepID=UPI00286F5F1C|nr:uncharacterized protein LOC132201307 [Neocloeon triangulifer]
MMFAIKEVCVALMLLIVTVAPSEGAPNAPPVAGLMDFSGKLVPGYKPFGLINDAKNRPEEYALVQPRFAHLPNPEERPVNRRGTRIRPNTTTTALPSPPS